MYRILGEADNWIEKREGRQRHFHRLPCQKGRPKILWLNSFDDCQWLLSCKDIFEWKFSRWPHGWQPDNYIKLGCSRWRTSAGWLIAFPKLNCHWAKTTSWVTNKLHGRNEIKYFVQTWRPKWHRVFITNNQSDDICKRIKIGCELKGRQSSQIILLRETNQEVVVQFPWRDGWMRAKVNYECWGDKDVF